MTVPTIQTIQEYTSVRLAWKLTHTDPLGLNYLVGLLSAVAPQMKTGPASKDYRLIFL